MDSNICGFAIGALTAATDKFQPLFSSVGSWASSAPAGLNAVVSPIAGTIKNLYIDCDAGPGVGLTRTFWVYKNGSNTGVTVALTGAGTGAGISTGSDLSNTVSVAVGDILALHTTASGTTTSALTTRFSAGFNAAANTSLVMAISGAVVSTAIATSYMPIQGMNLDATAGTNVEMPMPTGGTFKNAIMTLNAVQATGGTYVATLYQNGSPTALVVTLAAGFITSTDTGHTITVAAGDKFYWSILGTGSVANKDIALSMEFDPTTNGESVILGGGLPITVNSAARFTSLTQTASTWSNTESQREMITQACDFKKLYVVLITAPGGSAQYVAAASVGESTTGTPNATISAAATTGNDTSTTKTATAGQRISMKFTPSSTPATTVSEWGIVSYIAPPAASTTVPILSLTGAGL